jgi:hypothetical protein
MRRPSASRTGASAPLVASSALVQPMETKPPRARETRRRRLILAVALLVLVALALVLRPVAQQAFALSRSTDGFVPVSADARVLYEPGAEVEAAAVAAALPAAIATVERTLGGSFARPVAVHVCATLASFERFTGGDRAAGTTIGARLFLSPKLRATPDRVPKVVAHELTHLYSSQRMGLYAARRSFPPWFGEGLAAWVSGGGGAEGVSPAEAAQAIREGRRFVPDAPGLLSRGGTASDFGLDAHLFYAEGALFVGYLNDRDPEAFRWLLAALDAGEPFGRAFPRAYGTALDAAWADFVRSLGQ